MKIAEYNQMMAYLTRPEPLPQPKPEELLEIQEQNRINRLQNLMKDLDPVLMDESKEFIERENFADGTKAAAKKSLLKFVNPTYLKLKGPAKSTASVLKNMNDTEKFYKKFIKYRDKFFEGNTSAAQKSLFPDTDVSSGPQIISSMRNRLGLKAEESFGLKSKIKGLKEGLTFSEFRTKLVKEPDFLKKITKGANVNKFYNTRDLFNLFGITTERGNPKANEYFTGELKRAGVNSRANPAGGSGKQYKLKDIIKFFKEKPKTTKLGLTTGEVGKARISAEEKLDKDLYDFNKGVVKNVRETAVAEDVYIPTKTLRASPGDHIGHPVSVKITDKPEFKNLLKDSNVNKINSLVFQDAEINVNALNRNTGYDVKFNTYFKQLNKFLNKPITEKNQAELVKIKNDMDGHYNKLINRINKMSETNSFFKGQEKRIPKVTINIPEVGSKFKSSDLFADMSTVDPDYRYGKVQELNPNAKFFKDLSPEQKQIFKQNIYNQYSDNLNAFYKAAKIPVQDVEEFSQFIEAGGVRETVGKKDIIPTTEDTKNIKKIIASVGCPDAVKKADGGRIGFQDGTTCFLKGQKAINTGNIPEGAAKRNFAKFANKAMEIGKQSGRGLRTITKFGIIPEAIIIGADTLIRTGMGDTLNEAFLRASDIYRTDDAYEQADASEINRRMNSNDGELILNLRKFNAEKAQLDSLKQQKAADLALAGNEFAETNIGMTEDEIEQFYAPKIQEQENNLFNASISDAEERAGLKAETEFADKKGVDYKKSPVGAFFDYLGEKPGFKQAVDLFATEARGEPDVSAQTLENYLSGKIPQEEEKQLQKIIDTGGARGVLDAMKKIESLQQVPEGAIREPNVFDEERKTLMELAKTDSALAERLFGPSMTFAGDPIQQTDLQDEMNLDRGIYALGGRIGFADGPDNPNRRMFLKLMAGIASLPIVGKFLKPAAPVIQKLANTTTKMPDWFPAFIDNAFKKGIGKKVDADLTEIEIPDLPGVKVEVQDSGPIRVEGKNAYGEPYEIEYVPPGFEVIDETTGKAVKTPGEFKASDTVYRRVGPEGDDFDVDFETVDDVEQILGGDSTKLEGFAKGTGKSKYTQGQRNIDAAEAVQERADVFELEDIDIDYED